MKGEVRRGCNGLPEQGKCARFSLVRSKRFKNVNVARFLYAYLLHLLEGCQFREKLPILLTDREQEFGL